jgi:uracil-DNA glycosylase
MARTLDSKLRQQLAARLEYYREMGIYDFYRRRDGSGRPTLAAVSEQTASDSAGDNAIANEMRGVPLSCATVAARGKSGSGISGDVPAQLRAIWEDIGDCRLCRLAGGRKNIVFGTGNPHAELMFIGEAPGADEDEQGLPFVGRAGQLLNNMITAMGLRREDVYIANIIKCRPPGNRTPERDECNTCSPFLMRQLAAIRPKVIVALGAVAAKNLLAVNAPMSELRCRWYDFHVGLDSQGAPDANGPDIKLAVTYHPAFLLRDPRQKKEAWKDLQMVMKYMGLKGKPAANG